ncbi:piggyBac transposable element-derived protein 2-like [Vanessa cardui]|uniref:piggyBac transposable element-derived protein 2-like n=1 Tax=Vanessa cardui TaxID=171605 RepID=UPI001F133CD9|nr:piggyBac transposable element-derived protein 2-like [Vanessa cardui]
MLPIHCCYDVWETPFALKLFCFDWFSFLCQQPNRASKIIALVPNEHAPSDASEISDSETELHDERTNSSTPLSSPAPSIASSLANLTIDSTDNEESNVDVADIIPDSIVREITESNYENVPSLSAIPSLPSTPIAPLASSLSVSSRKTRSKKPPTVSAKRIKKAKKFQLTYNWRLAQFRHQVTIEADENENYNDLPADDSALSFFYVFFSSNILSSIVEQTNLYSVHETGKSIQLSEEEFRDFLALHVIMGIVVMPSYLDYWSDKFRYAKIADIMSLKRYQQIRRYLHFVDNNMADGDKYFKVRPVVEQIRQNCLKQQKIESKFSIDEMMIAYKGSKAGKRKQYMKDKPNKWGFKNYVRAGVSGIIYDFILYGGDDTFRNHMFSEEELSLGFGAQVVVALCQSIERKPATIFCDNFFSSPELLFILREKYAIFALGTIRSNRLRGADAVLPTEKVMKKKPRGNFVEAVCDQNRLAVVRWNDNKAVTFISSFVASEPLENIRRYCKDAKEKNNVQCPQIVRQYNRHMGGVDLADMLISLYKTPFKSRRWYLSIFAQMLDICINNAWLLYRRKHSSNAKAKISLKAFRYDIYDLLLKENRSAKRNRTEATKIVKPHVARPPSPVKYDNVGHFPSTMEEGRCRFCLKKTVVYCIKCNIRLCFVTGKNPRNCFLNFHTK